MRFPWLFFVSLRAERNKNSFNTFSIYGKIHQAGNDRPQR